MTVRDVYLEAQRVMRAAKPVEWSPLGSRLTFFGGTAVSRGQSQRGSYVVYDFTKQEAA